MSMPNDLVLVRHGESTGNEVIEAAKRGDLTGYTEEFMTIPGSQWRLTDKGRAQAAAIGGWVDSGVTPGIYWGRGQAPHYDPTFPHFDRYMVSPYKRARETGGAMGLSGARWMENRALRERDWGDIGSIPREHFQDRDWWKQNASLKKSDPLYWCAPNGESVAHVAENRVRNVLNTLSRENSKQRVVLVSHGETIQAFRLVLERMSDERFVQIDRDPAERILNCEAIHYTRIDPDAGPHANRSIEQRLAPKLTWMRRAKPVQLPDGSWSVEVGGWTEIEFRLDTNEELLAGVEAVPAMRA